VGTPDFDYTTFRTSLGSTIEMREAIRLEYLLMKDAQSSHSKSWDITLWNVKTSKEIDEDLMVFR
jgi:hypothetical protein